MHTQKLLPVLVALFPLARSTAIELKTPAHSTENRLEQRDQIFTDVVRLMKCDHLTRIEPGVGGYEMGQFAYWKDKSSTGPPDDRVVFDMKDRIEDRFYNGYGNTYGGKSEEGKLTCIHIFLR